MDLIEEAGPSRTAPSVDEMAEFRSQVSEWVKLDEQVKKLRIAVRERMVHQKALGSQIQDFMKRFNYDDLNTQNGRIKHKVREVKAPLKLTEVKTKLYTIVEEGASRGFNDETIKKIHEIFEGERPVTKKEGLRRIVPKVSLSLDL
jgi:seryl-tRNA synthetase